MESRSSMSVWSTGIEANETRAGIIEVQYHIDRGRHERRVEKPVGQAAALLLRHGMARYQDTQWTQIQEGQESGSKLIQ